MTPILWFCEAVAAAAAPGPMTPRTGRSGKRSRTGSMARAEAVLQATTMALTPRATRVVAISSE
ncbi:MAG: hypothetical protein P8J87_14890 [Verrucomicrobiales bacterium]|nr:hypothetical protein [Verrucomicrobiales bacterium]